MKNGTSNFELRAWRENAGVVSRLGRGLLVLSWLALGNAAPAADHESHSAPPVAGAEKTGKTKLLEAGAELLQGEAPLRSIHAHVCGFHFYSGEQGRQVRADHYCAHLSEDVMQCVIYDSDKKNARLIGIEYIISEALFRQLPEEEKKLWHSHRHEVMSGELVAPGLPEIAEKELMEKLVTTYGKTWHTWQVDRDARVPVGIPQLMMAFTADGQIDANKVSARNAELGIDQQKKRQSRAAIPAAPVAPGADAWQKGEVFQLELRGKSPASAPAPKATE
jgi:hypothetical protein